jgi:AcrR family transcriptional regulator
MASMGNGSTGLGGRPSGAAGRASPTAGAGSRRASKGASKGASKKADKKKTLDPADGRLVRGRKSRVRILAAARELFDERGFDGATLRAIAERAGMGASSIYRHVRSKEELLIGELVALQQEAWRRFRETDNRAHATRDRIQAFLDVQHALFVSDRDFTAIAVRCTTRSEVRVAKQVFALNDKTIGLLFEILQMGRRDLARGIDALEAARVIFAITQGARIPWSNGLMSDAACASAIRTGVDILFQGLEA